MSIFLEHKLITTIAIILLSYPIKHYITAWIKHQARKHNKDRRYLSNTFKNVFNLVIVILLAYLWSYEIQRFALSIAAFIVAIVLATREYIQCFIGFLYVTSTRPFGIGDWVQTGPHCGEVISTDWAKLTMLEIDQTNYQYTGKTLFIPNNQLITQPIRNLNYLKRYINLQFTITMNGNFNPYQHYEKLMINARKYCEDFQSVAERYKAMIERSLDITLADIEPKITISTTDLGRVKTTFTLFCPTELAGKIEQQITQDFFSLSSQQQKVVPLCDDALDEMNSTQ